MLLNNLAAELSFLRALSHPNLLAFHGACVALPPPPLPPLPPLNPGGGGGSGGCSTGGLAAAQQQPVIPAVQPFEAGSWCVAMAFEVAREGCLERRVARTRRAMDAAVAAAAASTATTKENAGAAAQVVKVVEAVEAAEAAALALSEALFPWALRVPGRGGGPHLSAQPRRRAPRREARQHPPRPVLQRQGLSSNLAHLLENACCRAHYVARASSRLSRFSSSSFLASFKRISAPTCVVALRVAAV